jgi:hypothetical protein
MSDETQASPEQTTETDAPVVETPAQSEPEFKAHPAHEKLLSEIPEAWHQKVIPHLQDQDKYYQKEMEKFSPFKEYVDQGISAEVISGGINLARAIETNPTEVYASLQDYLVQNGMLKSEAAAAAQEMMEDETGEDFDDLFEDDVPPALKRELDELKSRQAEADDYIYQQELDKATSKEIETLESEMSALRQAHNISEAHEVAIYDLMNAALNAGREISVAEAAQQLQAMVGPFGSASAGEAPPTIVGSSGGAGIPAPNLAIPKDDKGKKEMMARLFEDYQRANR